VVVVVVGVFVFDGFVVGNDLLHDVGLGVLEVGVGVFGVFDVL